MSGRGFAGSLLFAAASGLASYPLTLLLTPWLGWWGAPGAVFALWVVLYSAGLLRGRAPRVLAAVALIAVALGLHAVDPQVPFITSFRGIR